MAARTIAVVEPEAGETLEGLLRRYTREGELYEKLPEGKLRCYACAHRCVIPPGLRGVCRVRYNEGGTLRVPWGYMAAIQLDPIEKKPFFHAYPGASALSFGMLGCDFHCSYCQNWVTSQALRDPAAGTAVTDLTPEAFAELALRHGAKVVTTTYNEPLITSEWAMEVFRAAEARGLVCSYVSNGNATEEVLDYIRPHVRLYKVDLKGFDDARYRQLGGVLEHVKDAVRMLVDKGFWLEVVTLVVPGFNDSDDELSRLARFLVSVRPDIPWHVTAFHSDYKMSDRPDTATGAIVRGARIGKAEGLRFVYAGNRPGEVGELENTYCPTCGELLVERVGFRVLQNRVSGVSCPGCRSRVPGLWS